MRMTRWLLPIAVAMMAGLPAATVAGAATSSATVRVVVRPVTSTGHLRSGYTLTTEPTQSVGCGDREPSPGAVDPDIEFCAPSAEYAIACWQAAAPARALCMRDPRSRTMVRIPLVRGFAKTPIAPLAQRAPLYFRLADGDICQIRDGGAWSQLPGRPDLFGTYGCRRAGNVWASATARHDGVNEAHPVWTVLTAPFDGHRLVLRHVVKAWFVGTYSG